MKSLIRSRKTLTLGVLLTALAISGCNAASQAADADESRATSRETIAVSGFGEAIGPPDIATIDLGVEVEADDVASAVESSNETAEQITDALVAFGIEASDIQSTRFGVWREEGFDRLTGMPTDEVTYHVDSTVRVTVRDIDQISSVIQTGLDAGANNVYGLTFGIDDTSELGAEARLLALDDAEDRAQQIANALGVTLGKPIAVSELVGGTSFGALSEAAFFRGIGGGGGGPPVSPGELEVGVQVDVMYEVEE